MSTLEEKSIYFPTLKVLNAKDQKKRAAYGPRGDRYYWFANPHHLEYREEMQVKIFCSFDFTYFPYDSNDCDLLLVTTSNSIGLLKLSPLVLEYNKTKQSLNQEPLEIEQNLLPFNIHMASLEPFSHEVDGYNYSISAMRLHFKRNSLGSLAGGFYGPMGAFSILSLISYAIKPEVVRLRTTLGGGV